MATIRKRGNRWNVQVSVSVLDHALRNLPEKLTLFSGAELLSVIETAHLKHGIFVCYQGGRRFDSYNAHHLYLNKATDLFGIWKFFLWENEE